MRHECYFCHIKTIEKLIKKFNPEANIAEDLIFSTHELIGANRSVDNPELATIIHRTARKKLNTQDLYAQEKELANKDLLAHYNKWSEMVNKSKNPFHTAVKLAVIGNIIDYGAHSAKQDVVSQVKSLFEHDLKVDMVSQLQKEIEKANSILYLGDNCGEIVFDKLLIKTMSHPNVTFAVRGNPVINDITIDDAKQVGIDKVCNVMSNGTDAPSTILEMCSENFLEAFNKADLIISKGQGNFEGLMNNKKTNIFFLLIAKCNPIAELLNVDVNDMVVTKTIQ